MKVLEMRISEIVPYQRNARVHSEKQVGQIAESIREFGFTNPVLVDGKRNLIAGHGRLEAAKLLGMERVPSIVLDGLTDSQVRALRIADNKLAINATWDTDLLAVELEELKLLDLRVDLTGFDVQEISELGNLPEMSADTDAEQDAEQDDLADDTPSVPSKPVSKLGDVWVLGDHLLMCADVTNHGVLDMVLDGRVPDVVMADPPYGIEWSTDRPSALGVKGKWCKTKSWGKIQGDDDSNLARISFGMCAYFYPKARQIWWGANYYPSALPNGYGWVVWDKGISPDFDLSGCEIAFCNKGKKSWLFKHMWSGALKDSERRTETLHSNQKPVALIEWCFDNVCDIQPQSIVLDPFSGSGTVMMACEKRGYQCVSIEVDPKFVDVAIKRWQTYSGKQAILKATGQTFGQVSNDSFNDSFNDS